MHNCIDCVLGCENCQKMPGYVAVWTNGGLEVVLLLICCICHVAGINKVLDEYFLNQLNGVDLQKFKISFHKCGVKSLVYKPFDKT